MYTRRMKRRSKFKVTRMYKRITGIGLKREETGARWGTDGVKNFHQKEIFVVLVDKIIPIIYYSFRIC